MIIHPKKILKSYEGNIVIEPYLAFGMVVITKGSLEPEKEGLMAISKRTTGNGHTGNITEAAYKTKER